MTQDILRVLVVDDSMLYRKLVSDAVNQLPTTRLSGFARDGEDALDKIEKLKPDLVTLDVEMPRMNGLEALREIRRRWPNQMVVMVSGLTKSGAAETMEALSSGAFSFIQKPSGSNAYEDLKSSLKSVVNEIQFQQKP